MSREIAKLSGINLPLKKKKYYIINFFFLFIQEILEDGKSNWDVKVNAHDLNNPNSGNSFM